jgi:hypothetical protein
MKKGSLQNITIQFDTLQTRVALSLAVYLTLPDPTDPTIISNLFPLISTLMSSKVVLSFVQLYHKGEISFCCLRVTLHITYICILRLTLQKKTTL